MKIQGNTQPLLQPSAANKPPQDHTSQQLQRQIGEKQKQLQELAKDTNTPPQQKMQKRQELQKEVYALQNELRTHEMELRRQQKENTTPNKATSNSTSDQLTHRLLSADAAMLSSKALGSVRTSLKDDAAILSSEIKQDKSYGSDTTKKEADLDALEARIRDVADAQQQKLSSAMDEMKADDGEEPSDKKEPQDTPARHVDERV